MKDGSLWRGLLALLIMLPALLPASAAANPGNGIQDPADGATIRRIVEVRAYAQDRQFQKWQLDLLPGGKAERAVFLAVGEEPLEEPGVATQLDTTRFPDGDYRLRLRVVRQDGNYDEHFIGLTIDNRGAVGPGGSAEAASIEARKPNQVWPPSHTAEGRPILYLTFDDGPHPRLTRQLLGVLAQHDARATFFAVGYMVRKYPTVLQEVIAAGHGVANHTEGHRSLVGLGPEAFQQQVQGLEERIGALLEDLNGPGYYTQVLRPPYGHVDAAVEEQAAALGYRLLQWDLDPKDWRQSGADAIASAVIQRAYAGAVVILHDGGGGSSQTVEAVERILESLGEQGYQFHPVPASGG